MLFLIHDNSYVDKLFGIEKNQAIKDINLFGGNFSTKNKRTAEEGIKISIMILKNL